MRNYTTEQLQTYLRRNIFFREFLLANTFEKIKFRLRAVNKTGSRICFCYEGAQCEYFGRVNNSNIMWTDSNEIFDGASARPTGEILTTSSFLVQNEDFGSHYSHPLFAPSVVQQFFGSVSIRLTRVREVLNGRFRSSDLKDDAFTWHSPQALNDKTDLSLEEISDLVIESIQEEINKREFQA